MKKLFEKIRSFWKNKIARRITIFLAIFASIAIIESTAFNYRAYQSRGVKQDIAISEVITSDTTKSEEKDKDNKTIYTMNTNNYPTFKVEFSERTEVKTIYFDINFDDPAA